MNKQSSGTSLVAEFVNTARIHDTHEHMVSEEVFLGEKPDVLRTIFCHYVTSDLCVAGASLPAVEMLINAANPDIATRFRGVKTAWDATRLTGYGEAASTVAQHFYGMEQITEAALIEAQASLPARWNRGDRLRLLKEVGNYDHIQNDDFVWSTQPDPGEGDFFLKDLSWAGLASGLMEFEKLYQATNIKVHSLESLREAMAQLFARYAPCAIAVKSQHAYHRSLAWTKRSDAEVRPLINRAVGDAAKLTDTERLCLGDWCLAEGVELSIKYNLPFKIHTGYKAGHGCMDVSDVSPALLCPLLRAYPGARFVLMHTGYPFLDETLGMAKHFPNVWIDLCWAWAINPRATGQFVRSFIRSVPLNKLFGFGGDSLFPHHSVAFSRQMRRHLVQALEGGVRAGDFSERQAVEIARRLLQGNQEEFFDLKRVRQANREWLSGRTNRA